MKRLELLRCALVLFLVVSILSNIWLSPIRTCDGSDCEEEDDHALQPEQPVNETHETHQYNGHTSVVETSSHSNSTLSVRILLGISSYLNIPSERQRRHLVRNTYLDFDRLHLPQQPNRVCSLQRFRKLYSQNKELIQDCRLVYTFILGPVANDTSFMSNHTNNYLLRDPSTMDNHEKDVIYLNVAEEDRVGKIRKWFRYANRILEGGVPIDYVVHTDVHLAVLPSVFWTNPILQLAQDRVYAGLPTVKTKCIDQKCPSLLGEYVMRRFVMLSRDLVKFVATLGDNLPTLAIKESPDVDIANELYKAASTLGPIHNVSLVGLVPKTSANGLVGDYLFVWDRYKDAQTTYEDPNEVSLVESSPANVSHADQPPRILLGIMTTLGETEKERRHTIRRTYLTAFKSSSPHRICSLHEIETLPNEFDCQMAYTFVVGANPNGPTELVDDSIPITIQAPPLLPDEPDTTYLNIRENMKEGKSQTWLKFATTVVENHYFDYIGKTDTDTLLYPRAILNGLVSGLRKFPTNLRVYGGDYRIVPSLSTLNVGPVYMAGHFYFLSVDLARYIVSPQCNRTALAVFSEDQSIGNFVHSHPKPIRRIRVNTNMFEHPVKRVDRMRTLWRKHTGG